MLANIAHAENCTPSRTLWRSPTPTPLVLARPTRTDCSRSRFFTLTGQAAETQATPEPTLSMLRTQIAARVCDTKRPSRQKMSYRKPNEAPCKTVFPGVSFHWGHVRSCLCPKTTFRNIHRQVAPMCGIRNDETLPDLATFGC